MNKDLEKTLSEPRAGITLETALKSSSKLPSFYGVFPLYEGTFSVGLDKKFNPIHRSEQAAPGSLKLSIHPFLIREEKRNILFDAGIGDLFGKEPGTGPGGEPGAARMHENLHQAGISSTDVTDIFLSHLHFDHMAGLLNREHGSWELTFPNAAIYLSGADWKAMVGRADTMPADKGAFVHYLDTYGDLHFLGEDDHPLPTVRTCWIGGHTDHHLALYYENASHKYMMAGDVIGSRKALMRKFRAVYDADSIQGMNAREALKKQAWEEQYNILAYHETDTPIMRLAAWDARSGYQIEEAS